MKILVLNPFAGEAREFERCATVARADTAITFDTIADVYPLNYVTYIYYRHKCAEAVAERVVRAEAEGFDGVLRALTNSEQALHASFFRIATYFRVQGIGAITELSHFAEHQPSRSGKTTQRIQTCLQRARIGVI